MFALSVEKFREIVSKSQNIVFFGGAGTSTESGIPDFRSEAGLYNTENGYSFPPETILSHTFFINNTDIFYKFYRSKMVFTDAKPNLAHKALAELERRGKLKAVITQNIDGLHQTAGSKTVLELHGSIMRNFCTGCGKNFGLSYVMDSRSIIPKCDECGMTIKPDVVLYEEMLDMDVLARATAFIANAEVLIVGGTSLVVQPAASLVNYFKGKSLILINKSPTPYDNYASIVIDKSIGETLNSIL